MDVPCPNKDLGCNIILKYEKIKNHLNDDCLFEYISCPKKELGCNANIMREKIQEHLKKDCQFVQICVCGVKIVNEENPHSKCLIRLEEKLRGIEKKLTSRKSILNNLINEEKTLNDEIMKKEAESNMKAKDNSDSKEESKSNCRTQTHEKKEDIVINDNNANIAHNKNNIIHNEENPIPKMERKYNADGRIYCGFCGRCFNKRVIDRHERICGCQQVLRKPFDSKSQRHQEYK